MHQLSHQTERPAPAHAYLWHLRLWMAVLPMLLASTQIFADTDATATPASETPAPTVTATFSIPSLPELLPMFDAEAAYGFIEQQLQQGEAADAQQALETVVAQIESLRHRHDEELVVPLTLLADALMEQAEYDRALDIYDRARHTARVSYGLFDARQLPVVYREADAFRTIGDLRSAIQREEYAFEVVERSLGRDDLQRLPHMMRLAAFYLQTHNYFAARVLFNMSMDLLGQYEQQLSLHAIPYLQGIALTHRLERFPPFYVASTDDNRLMGPMPGLRSEDLSTQFVSFNNFPAGEKALQQIIQILREQTPEDTAAVQEAFLALADWHLLFGRSKDAFTLYEHIYLQLVEAGEDPGTLFGTPRLIYFPIPEDLKIPPDANPDEVRQGQVTLGFSVSPTGRIRKMTTLSSEPTDLMDFRVRRSMRQAIFRPMLVDAMPVTAEEQSHRYDFSYYQSADQNLDSQPRNVNAEPAGAAPESASQTTFDEVTPSDVKDTTPESLPATEARHEGAAAVSANSSPKTDP